MGIFELIEKGINEHGSAVILKERIDLARDQYYALEKKNVELLGINQFLSQKIATLEAENSSLKAENVKINKEINDVNKNKNNLPKEQEEILKLISHKDTPENEIFNQTNALPQVVQYHLDELKAKNFIEVQLIMNSNPFSNIPAPNIWYVTKMGRKYLIENNIL
jgi:chromosome segregation ATPase